MIWHEKPILGIIYFLYEGCITTWSIVLLMWSHLIIHIPRHIQTQSKSLQQPWHSCYHKWTLGCLALLDHWSIVWQISLGQSYSCSNPQEACARLQHLKFHNDLIPINKRGTVEHLLPQVSIDHTAKCPVTGSPFNIWVDWSSFSKVFFMIHTHRCYYVVQSCYSKSL